MDGGENADAVASGSLANSLLMCARIAEDLLVGFFPFAPRLERHEERTRCKWPAPGSTN
jgi:hypothetical protein